VLHVICTIVWKSETKKPNGNSVQPTQKAIVLASFLTAMNVVTRRACALLVVLTIKLLLPFRLFPQTIGWLIAIVLVNLLEILSQPDSCCCQAWSCWSTPSQEIEYQGLSGRLNEPFLPLLVSSIVSLFHQVTIVWIKGCAEWFMWQLQLTCCAHPNG